jgi:hypothetical protein
MLAWLSRQRSGDYMLTSKRPVKHPVDGRDNCEDLYVAAGDSLGLRHMCPWGVMSVFGIELRTFQSVEVDLNGRPWQPVDARISTASVNVDRHDHSENHD